MLSFFNRKSHFNFFKLIFFTILSRVKKFSFKIKNIFFLKYDSVFKNEKFWINDKRQNNLKINNYAKKGSIIQKKTHYAKKRTDYAKKVAKLCKKFNQCQNIYRILSNEFTKIELLYYNIFALPSQTKFANVSFYTRK